MAITLVYNEKGRTWINVTDCQRMMILGREAFISALGGSIEKSYDYTENRIEYNTNYGILFIYPSIEDNYHIGGFEQEQEAIDYLQDMLNKAMVLGRPNG